MSADSARPGFNPWPYAIIGFFGIAIVAAIVWVAFCVGHGTDLVASDYYEQEVVYQDQIDRLQGARSLANPASIVYDADARCIRIQIPRDPRVPPPAGVVHLYRPSQANLDRTLPLNVDGEGGQQIDVSSMKPGLWDVRVRWTAQGREFLVTEKLSILSGRS